MDTKSLFKLSYGLYLLTANVDGKDNGCIINTAVQVANNGIKEEILDCMANEPNRLFTISEMQKVFPCCAELSNQRVSALVRQLVADGKVERLEEKRKAVFRIAR